MRPPWISPWWLQMILQPFREKNSKLVCDKNDPSDGSLNVRPWNYISQLHSWILWKFLLLPTLNLFILICHDFSRVKKNEKYANWFLQRYRSNRVDYFLLINSAATIPIHLCAAFLHSEWIPRIHDIPQAHRRHAKKLTPNTKRRKLTERRAKRVEKIAATN